MSEGWNHNFHYYPHVLASTPEGCKRALDVGCGEGLLTRRLALRCGAVVGIDLDAVLLGIAAAQDDVPANLEFIAGDVMSCALPRESFHFITVVAALHHLPLRPALGRFGALLRPGGVLVVIGLYRPVSLLDHAFAAGGAAASWLVRRFRTHGHQRARMTAPHETLSQVRAAAEDCLPGAAIRRRLFFRYSLIWRKPGQTPDDLKPVTMKTGLSAAKGTKEKE